MYLETMQQILNSTSKVLVDSKSGQNLLYLPLNQLMQAAGATAAATSETAPRAGATVPEVPAAAAPDPARARDAARSREREAR
jgi:membrane protease subunit HflK